MKKKWVVGIVTGLLLFGVAHVSNATTIDFDDLLVDGTVYTSDTYSHDGFTLTNSHPVDSFTYFGSDSGYGETGALLNGWHPSVTTLKKDDNTLFSLNAIDLKIYTASGSVLLEGWDEDGNLVASITEFQASPDSWNTITLGEDFNNISRMTLSQGGSHWYMDNLLIGEAAPVPEPATMFLFGAGLVGLAGRGIGRNKR